MGQRIFNTTPANALEKIKQLQDEGWKIIVTANTSTPSTEPDAHGVSYGGPSFQILAEREYDKPCVLAGCKYGELPMSKPCKPPIPGGR